MTNELILRYTCAILVVVCLTLLFLWRVTREDVKHFKALSVDLDEQITKLFHEYNTVRKLCDKMVQLSSMKIKKGTQASPLPIGFPTSSIDISGKAICLGDTVIYDFDDNTSSFIVVFENNAFRKKYPKWDPFNEKPILEYGFEATQMRLKIVPKHPSAQKA